MFDDKQWIFVNYVPGAFGSFITKVIETSPDVYGNPGEVFNKNGASHNSLTNWIDNFHDGNVIEMWASLDLTDRENYISNAINVSSCRSTDLHRVHRLTVPSLHDLFVDTFTNAKFIKVVFEENYYDLIVDMMCKKTYIDGSHGALAKIKNKDPQLYKILKNVPMEHQRKWYRKQCITVIDRTKDIKPAERTLLFNVADLFNGNYNNAFNTMFKFLNIKPGQYTDLIEKFLEIHKFEETSQIG